MTAYFTNRDKNFNNTVLKETIQFLDAWFRNEFAKMRGAIHSHGIYYSPEHYHIVEDILKQHNDSVDIDLPAELHNWLQSDNLNKTEDELYSPDLKTMHPSGGVIENEENKGRKWKLDKSKWLVEDGGEDTT